MGYYTQSGGLRGIPLILALPRNHSLCSTHSFHAVRTRKCNFLRSFTSREQLSARFCPPVRVRNSRIHDIRSESGDTRVEDRMYPTM